MKANILLPMALLFSLLTLSAQSKKPENLKIFYSEYHAAQSFASENENERSLADYVQKFEVENQVKLSDKYRVDLTNYSGAYFFSLRELNDRMKTKFICGRLKQVDKEQMEHAVSMLVNKPKKLSVYVDAISDKKINKYIIWNPSDNGLKSQ